MTFKKGDKVILVNSHYYDDEECRYRELELNEIGTWEYEAIKNGTILTINKVYPDNTNYPYEIEFPNEETEIYCDKDLQLAQVSWRQRFENGKV